MEIYWFNNCVMLLLLWLGDFCGKRLSCSDAFTFFRCYRLCPVLWVELRSPRFEWCRGTLQNFQRQQFPVWIARFAWNIATSLSFIAKSSYLIDQSTFTLGPDEGVCSRCGICSNIQRFSWLYTSKCVDYSQLNFLLPL